MVPEHVAFPRSQIDWRQHSRVALGEKRHSGKGEPEGLPIDEHTFAFSLQRIGNSSVQMTARAHLRASIPLG
jgi:hypothetical protein